MSTRLITVPDAKRFDIRCTAIDGAVEILPVPVVFFFERRLDPNALADALTQALAQIPIYAGRMTIIEGVRRIRCEGQGVPFTAVKSDSTLADAIRSTAEGRGQWLVDMVHIGRARSGKAPLFTVRVTELADGGTAIGCCWHHSIGDMHSFMLLMKAWVAAAAGERIDEPIIVEDRVAYLDQNLPPDGGKTPAVRLLGFGDFARLTTYLLFGARKKKMASFYFGDEEIQRMREEYGANTRLSANDVVCAHVAESLMAADATFDQRSLGITVNVRKRCGLDEKVIGNMFSALQLDLRREHRAGNIAERIRRGVDRFAEDHCDLRLTQQFVDGVGSWAARRCAAAALDPVRWNLHITSWSNFGVYGVRFDDAVPSYFTPLMEYPIPWLGAMVEGAGGRGRLFAIALPHEVHAAASKPEAQKQLRRFRRAGDAIPRTHEDLHG